MTYRFFNNCVNWSPSDVHVDGGLCDMIASERGITRETFLKHVEREDRIELERALGYAPHDPDSGLTMKRDHHVSYHRSKLHGKRVYYFKHSGIEYVFKAAPRASGAHGEDNDHEKASHRFDRRALRGY